MRKPNFVTFTGVDDKTNVCDLISLSKRYPVEWGLLSMFSDKDRNASSELIKELLSHQLNLSYHLCGRSAELFQEGKFEIPGGFKRIQVNGKINDLTVLENMKINQEIIIQVKGFAKTSLNQLFDISAGRGIVPNFFPKHPGYCVGYAGGINPENVLIYLKNIDAQGEYWIDMETGVRTENIFDLNKVESVLRKIYD